MLLLPPRALKIFWEFWRFCWLLLALALANSEFWTSTDVGTEATVAIKAKARYSLRLNSGRACRCIIVWVCLSLLLKFSKNFFFQNMFWFFKMFTSLKFLNKLSLALVFLNLFEIYLLFIFYYCFFAFLGNSSCCSQETPNGNLCIFRALPRICLQHQSPEWTAWIFNKATVFIVRLASILFLLYPSRVRCGTVCGECCAATSFMPRSPSSRRSFNIVRSLLRSLSFRTQSSFQLR